jgi:hypothetical protein
MVTNALSSGEVVWDFRRAEEEQTLGEHGSVM